MKLDLYSPLADAYKSTSQKVRVLSEAWVKETVFCPSCGSANLDSQDNNKPVCDFVCSACREEYELKSKQNSLGKKIVDGAYDTMINRLKESNNPNFFLLSYEQSSWSVKDFVLIPKYFFSASNIEKRKPLASTARRAGWVGCNICLDHIPETGKIFYIKNGQALAKDDVLSKWKKMLFLKEEKRLDSKTWLIDIVNCIEKIGRKDFSLQDIYAFEAYLQMLHPENQHIKEKIRQQLQVLRDRGYLSFSDRGHYQIL